ESDPRRANGLASLSPVESSVVSLSAKAGVGSDAAVGSDSGVGSDANGDPEPVGMSPEANGLPELAGCFDSDAPAAEPKSLPKPANGEASSAGAAWGGALSVSGDSSKEAASSANRLFKG